MKNIVTSFLMMLVLTAVSSCESALDKDFPDSKSFLVVDGVFRYDIYDLRALGVEHVNYQLPVQCSGKESVGVQARLRVNAERMAEYNQLNYTHFVELPAECYTISNFDVAFRSIEEAGKLDIDFDLEKIHSLVGYEKENYVIPLELYEASGMEVSRNKDFILINPWLVEPVAKLQEAGVKDVELVKGVDKTVSVSTSLSFASPVATGFHIAVDPVILDAYNTANGTAVELLPEANYELETMNMAIEAGKTTLAVAYKLKPGELAFGKYMLPLRLTDVDNYAVSADGATVGILIIYGPQVIDRKNWVTLSGSGLVGDGDGIPGLLDGDINTFWHSDFTIGGWFSGPYELVFDMGQRYEISRYEVCRRQHESYVPGTAPMKHTIELSEDNVNWTKFAVETTLFSYDYQSFSVASTKARYVKYIGLTEACHMAEFRVVGLVAD